MLKAAGRTADGRELVLLGLSGENMTRLMAGEPILLELAELGLRSMQVMIVGGRDEAAMMAQLASHGLIPQCCPAHSATCEPPSELCCAACTEATHPDHPAGVRCVLDQPPNPSPSGR